MENGQPILYHDPGKFYLYKKIAKDAIGIKKCDSCSCVLVISFLALGILSFIATLSIGFACTFNVKKFSKMPLSLKILSPIVGAVFLTVIEVSAFSLIRLCNKIRSKRGLTPTPYDQSESFRIAMAGVLSLTQKDAPIDLKDFENIFNDDLSLLDEKTRTYLKVYFFELLKNQGLLGVKYQPGISEKPKSHVYDANELKKDVLLYDEEPRTGLFSRYYYVAEGKTLEDFKEVLLNKIVEDSETVERKLLEEFSYAILSLFNNPDFEVKINGFDNDGIIYQKIKREVISEFEMGNPVS